MPLLFQFREPYRPLSLLRHQHEPVLKALFPCFRIDLIRRPRTDLIRRVVATVHSADRVPKQRQKRMSVIGGIQPNVRHYTFLAGRAGSESYAESFSSGAK